MYKNMKTGGDMISVKDLNPDYITDAKGQKRAVILPLKEYEELLEDLNDLAVAAERRDESGIAHNKVMEELKRDGYVSD